MNYDNHKTNPKSFHSLTGLDHTQFCRKRPKHGMHLSGECQ